MAVLFHLPPVQTQHANLKGACTSVATGRPDSTCFTLIKQRLILSSAIDCPYHTEINCFIDYWLSLLTQRLILSSTIDCPYSLPWFTVMSGASCSSNAGVPHSLHSSRWPCWVVFSVLSTRRFVQMTAVICPALMTASLTVLVFIAHTSVQFKMVSKPSEKPLVMLSTVSLRSFTTVASETVPVFVWSTICGAEKRRQLNFLHWLPHLAALAGDGTDMLADNGLAGKTLGKWVYCPRCKDTWQVSVLPSLEDTGQVNVMTPKERHLTSECIVLAGKTLDKWVYCPRWKDTGQVSVLSSLERHLASVSLLKGLCTLPVVRRARCEDCWQLRAYRCQRCC